MTLRKRTITSKFGAPGRINHDSSPFYNSRLYQELPAEKQVKYLENLVPPEAVNRILHHTSEDMHEIPDNSIHLMVISPPYNVGNLGRKPYIPLHSCLIKDMLSIGFLMRGEIIWDKAASAGGSTAWGSWLSASNPTFRDVYEYILIFLKERFRRQPPSKRASTILKDQFLEVTKSIWSIPTVSAKKIGHQATFPLELPARLIQLYTFENKFVLDPFMGSGQTAIASLHANRQYVGFESNEKYVKLAENRINSTFAK